MPGRHRYHPLKNDTGKCADSDTSFDFPCWEPQNKRGLGFSPGCQRTMVPAASTVMAGTSTVLIWRCARLPCRFLCSSGTPRIQVRRMVPYLAKLFYPLVIFFQMNSTIFMYNHLVQFDFYLNNKLHLHCSHRWLDLRSFRLAASNGGPQLTLIPKQSTYEVIVHHVPRLGRRSLPYFGI